MKTETKDANSGDLEILQKHLRRIEKNEKKLSTCQADMVEMQERIQKIGKPSYKNDQAVNELAQLKQKLELCTEESAELEQELPPLRLALYNEIGPICHRAAMLLRPLVENRVSTITAVLRQFCDTDASALSLAKSTKAGQEAYSAISRIAQPPAPSGAQLRHLRLCINIFEEALKKDGDLLQFLSPTVSRSAGEGNSMAQGIATVEVSG